MEYLDPRSRLITHASGRSEAGALAAPTNPDLPESLFLCVFDLVTQILTSEEILLSMFAIGRFWPPHLSECEKSISSTPFRAWRLPRESFPKSAVPAHFLQILSCGARHCPWT